MSTSSSTAPQNGADVSRPLNVGVPAETIAGERRVSITPAVVPALVKLGVATVLVESGAGEAAGFPDDAYEDKGATDRIARRRVGRDRRDRRAGARRRPAAAPTWREYVPARSSSGMAAPLAAPEVRRPPAAKGATLYSLELLPRTTRAQSMDVLSSQANIAGYRRC